MSFYQLFFGDVTATQKIPNTIKAGEEVTVEVTIVKNDVNGFAKVQQTLPPGFFAEIIDAKGATFSFKDNIVKFIWMALPADKEFTITYKLKPNIDIIGDFSIAGKFSFISDNERKNVDIPPSNITIVKDLENASQPALAVIDNPVVENAPTTQTPIVIEKIETTTNITPAKVEIQSTRTIENLGNNYKVTVKINQTNLDGFAKFVDIVPSGFTASTDNPEGGIFSFSDGEAKILWMAAPKKAEFSVSYFIEPTDAKQGSYTISGTFSYLENDLTSKHNINSSTFNFNTQTIAQTETTVSNEQQPIIEKTPAIVEPVKQEKLKTPVVEKQPVKENTKSNITSVPSAEKGVTYKVQVGAGHQTVSNSYFASKFNLTDAVSTESHEGWIKYIVGKYTEYQQARDKRNMVRNNVKNAFVTAYNQGKRITVQEALMISNQKWYQ